MGEVTSDLGDNDIRTRGYNNGSRTFVANGQATCLAAVSPTRPQFWGGTSFIPEIATGEDRRGLKWALGRGLHGSITTISPPNKGICMGNGHSFNDGVLPPSSRHQGGVHILMGDGAVRFITDSIESGNQNSPQVCDAAGGLTPGSPSPFGLWGALGTRASNETVTLE